MDRRIRDRLRVLWWLALPFFPAIAVAVWLGNDSGFLWTIRDTWKGFRVLAGKRDPDPWESKP